MKLDYVGLDVEASWREEEVDDTDAQLVKARPSSDDEYPSSS